MSNRLSFVLALACVAGAATSASAQVQWRSPLASAFTGQADVPAVLNAIDPAIEMPHAAVQLVRVPNEAERAALAAAGIRLGAPLGNAAFFASVNRAVFDAKSPAMGLVAGAQAIDAQWKLHPAFAANDPAAWVSVGAVAAAAGEGEGAVEQVVALYVVLHTDVVNDANAAALVAKHGGVVRNAIKSVNGLVVEMPISAAAALAAEDAVQWIEPALPLLTPNNAENRTLTRANQAQAAPYSLNGAGITAFVFDGGTVRTTHQDFGGRATVIDGAGTANHATHVAGTIGGSGAASGGTNRGMAPGVTILSAALNAGSGFLYTNPGDIEADYTQAFSLGADIANNSIGTNTESNGFSCDWQGDYGVTDALIDSIVRGDPDVSGGAPYRIVWAAGNERQGSRCDVEGFGDYRSIAPPAGAKNHLSIGAINANDESMTSFSSWGPTDDGRLKPDFCAPGCQSTGDGGVTSTGSASDTAYSVSCGTSMASPTMTGLASLLLQDWAAQYPGDPFPRNSTLKVLFAQSAVDRGNVGPDYQFGYGSVRVDAAIDLMRTGAFDEDSVSQSFSNIYSVTVAPGSGPLVFTLAWDDPAATPNVVPSLINDLDLRVTAPNGVRHYPWGLNPANPSAAADRTQEDHLNNLEQVRVDAPLAGVWTIEVRGTAVPLGPQPYSVVASDPSFAQTGSVSITLTPVALAPVAVPPGAPISVSVELDIDGDTLVPGSMLLHYRFDGGAFTAVPMSPAGGDVFQASIPAPGCDDQPEYYFTAQGTSLGSVSLPSLGAAAPFSTIVGDLTATLYDMEAAAGWSAGAAGDTATTGIWERADPQTTAAQPGDDHTPGAGVNCWVTGAQAGSGVGSFDVDGGITTLLSPVFDLSNAGAATKFSYWRWYSNTAGAAPNADTFTVGISNNGGANWSTVEVVGPSGPEVSGGWFFREFVVSDLVPLTSTVRVRFVAGDLNDGSIVEAAVDDFIMNMVECSDACLADFDGNGTHEVPDIFAYLSAWFAQDPSADVDGVPGITVPDIFFFLSAWFAGC